MKGGPQISSLAAGIAIAVVVGLVVFFGIKTIKGPGKVQMSQEMVKKMSSMHSDPVAPGSHAPGSGPTDSSNAGR